MNPSTALATVLVDELVRGGVRDVVLSPGSRSAPLALAVHAADAAGRLRLHVRIDERSAGFLALGLAKASGTPVPVVTTSGTAVLNLHPAVAEARQSGVPLVLLTADRPPELRGTGANQTVDQVKAFGDDVVEFFEVGAASVRPGEAAYWRSLTCRALASARHEPGPVHLNLALREPLVPDGDSSWPEPFDGRQEGRPWTDVLPAAAPDRPVDDLPARTVVVLGDGADARAAQALAAARGWPVVAEPSSGAAPSAEVLPVPDLLLGTGRLPLPDRVLVVGRPTLSRAVGRLIASTPADVVARAGRWPDPSRTAGRALPAVPAASGGAVDREWLTTWQAAGAAASAAVDKVLSEADGLAEPLVARAVLDAAERDGATVVAGSSTPVRDAFLAGPREGVRVLANRGAAGIDGTVSTACGVALSAGPAFALLGDLTFLHDANGLVLGPQERRPDLTLVVVDNDGGGIFGLLEQGAPEHAGAFERVFGTPHGVDLAALSAATGTTYRTWDGELTRPCGLQVVHARTDRAAGVRLTRRLREAVAAALSG
ncbi:MAG TPA: 2-succinyl-5-enolpyruvyl-6-hydroxy-3-cyclohexene-1-carboxylic-acid synthase [Mycobacteriales bacterium]|nr:2-succinyl-5-enolpyruvyl-6-hydroxy-3-cyclohexene-1-carboxylic-acid synthase [Mycobacteriales bacterium]